MIFGFFLLRFFCDVSSSNNPLLLLLIVFLLLSHMTSNLGFPSYLPHISSYLHIVRMLNFLCHLLLSCQIFGLYFNRSPILAEINFALYAAFPLRLFFMDVEVVAELLHSILSCSCTFLSMLHVYYHQVALSLNLLNYLMTLYVPTLYVKPY